MKSKILLLLFIVLMVNTALIFRAGVNTLFFAVDTRDEYTPVQAVVEKLQVDPGAGEGTPPVPVFSFIYKENKITMPAPELRPRGRSFQQGTEYTLWLHSGRGELIWPPRASQHEIGRSQMAISAGSFLLAILVWVLRSKIKKD